MNAIQEINEIVNFSYELMNSYQHKILLVDDADKSVLLRRFLDQAVIEIIFSVLSRSNKKFDAEELIYGVYGDYGGEDFYRNDSEYYNVYDKICHAKSSPNIKIIAVPKFTHDSGLLKVIYADKEYDFNCFIFGENSSQIYFLGDSFIARNQDLNFYIKYLDLEDSYK